MTPIIKNVTVTDELGNEYDPTYAKRARGLVKKGRARFVTENRICLTRPPTTILEDVQVKVNTD
ncbi:MAG: YaaA family protein, partial [Oscillospiraceae bacterium]|nr:YaaA family protein [Oscillospiraceae bacterium]